MSTETMRLRAQHARLHRAVLDYATLTALDLMKPHEIRNDLLAVLGTRHHHKRTIGSDECLLCKRDLRDPVHLRSKP